MHDVGDEVDEDDEDRQDERRTQDDRIVACRDLVDQQAADPWYREDVLDHDCAADQEREVDSEHHDERRDRIPEDVAMQDREPADPLDAGGVEDL